MNTIEELSDCFNDVTPMGYMPRKGQLEVAQKIIKAFEDGKKHVVYEGPTGSGKSIVGMVVAEYLNRHLNSKCLFSTVTHSLQDQYMDDFGNHLRDIRGSSNDAYRCVDGYVRTDPECKAQVKKNACNNVVTCPYIKDMSLFRVANKKITNLQFAIRSPLLHSKSVIIDECHELSKIITSAVEFTCQKVNPTYALSILGTDYNDFKIMWDDIRTGLSKHDENSIFKMEYSEGAKACRAMLDNKLEYFNYDEVVGNDTLKKSIMHCRALLATLNTMLMADKTKMIAYKDMIFKPIYASTYTETMLFHKADRFLHMSATICGFKGYCNEVGIESNDAIFVESEHVIPVERREVEIDSVAWMSMKNYDSDLKKTVAYIDKLFDKCDRKNMILHTVSYNRAEDIAKNSKHKIHVPRKHKEVVELLKSKKEGIIVASPSIVAGIDAKDDMARLNVICKLPYPSFGDPRVRYISKENPELFNLGIIRDIVQACGRTTRHEEDYSSTIILDGNVTRILKQYKHLFPNWFLDALKGN